MTNVFTLLTFGRAEFQWDPRKNAANIAKHGVSFEQASRIFEGAVLTWIDDRDDYGERRRVSIGMIDGMAVLTLVHTDRDGGVRIISARPASRRERQFHEQKAR